jgi:hypothetical protein
MRPFILVRTDHFPVSAFAEFMDASGNPVIPAISYRRLPGQPPHQSVPDRLTRLTSRDGSCSLPLKNRTDGLGSPTFGGITPHQVEC